MRHRYIRAILTLTLVFSLVSTPVAAVVATTQPSESVGQVGLSNRTEVESWLDETMADQLERHHIPGAAVVIVKDGKPFISKGYGYADLESETPVVSNETVFPIGSTAKLLTWTAVMQGVEEGRLDTDRDINTYLNDSPVTIPNTYPQPVTLEHLGTHTAGFEEEFGGTLVDDPSEIRPLGETLAENQPARVRPPGEFVAYSNYGTALAGHVVAEQYNTTFIEYVDDRVLGPLAMNNSTYEQPLPARLEPRTATGYTYQEGNYQPQPTQYWGLPPEGGAMQATATDMGKFMIAHLNEGQYGSQRILKAPTAREMHRQHFSNAPNVPEQNGMAYGFIEMSRNQERIIGHWGTTAQFMSLLALHPEDDTGLFVVYNSPGGDAARFELLDAFVDRYYPQSATPKLEPPAGTADRAAKLTGDYRTLAISETSWHRILGVLDTVSVRTTEDGHLTTQAFGGPTRQWVEVRPGVYEEVGDDNHLVFRDGGAEGVHLSFGQFGSRTYERLAWYESLLVTQAILIGGLLAFVSMLVLWAGGPVWRWVRNKPAPRQRSRVARALLGVASLIWLAVTVIFLFGLLNFDAEVASPSLLLRVGQVLPYLGLVGTIVAVVVTGLAWRDRYWNVPTRLHYSLVTVIALLFAWQLYYLQILSL